MKVFFLQMIMGLMALNSAYMHAGHYEKKVFLEQIGNEEPKDCLHYEMGLYSLYMCTNCGTTYNSHPGECSICGETSFRLSDSTAD